MAHAPRQTIAATRRYGGGYGETAEVLDESTVLQRLEADLGPDEDRARIIGIGNGLVIGSLLWALIITAVVVAL